ncbi:YqiA/YcfP family alpha/beta fold hydrolase [Shewanella sp. NIFS-20-20]|uniref:YqiA/YcfP family alpha/beta fold hydrolase n=1 Tax=Shewanella sp. NIFS-20-20 TaxID=2853806 RepID=UPI001C48C621|nr:YqiA/YcfP family alpha/beta fold hydrolase [Shewanella sp. NIFS-20-20]MBV7317049.1 esterase YqiA [Shewanella sp. NIFS-20-20]
MLLYIHGFNSSPQSDKARITLTYCQTFLPQLKVYQPQLPSNPAAAFALLCDITEQAIAAGESLHYMGSSLGGFFATILAERYGGKAVLINPAVEPHLLMTDLLGLQTNPYTNEQYRVTLGHRSELAAMAPKAIMHPDRFYVLLQSGDEVLDYRNAVAFYHCCAMHIEPGGNHSFEGYQEQLDGIFRFLALTT